MYNIQKIEIYLKCPWTFLISLSASSSSLFSFALRLTNELVAIKTKLFFPLPIVEFELNNFFSLFFSANIPTILPFLIHIYNFSFRFQHFYHFSTLIIAASRIFGVILFIHLSAAKNARFSLANSRLFMKIEKYSYKCITFITFNAFNFRLFICDLCDTPLSLKWSLAYNNTMLHVQSSRAPAHIYTISILTVCRAICLAAKQRRLCIAQLYKYCLDTYTNTTVSPAARINTILFWVLAYMQYICEIILSNANSLVNHNSMQNHIIRQIN